MLSVLTTIQQQQQQKTNKNPKQDPQEQLGSALPARQRPLGDESFFEHLN